MESREVARKRILSLIDSKEPSGIVAEAKFHLKANTVAKWRQGTLHTFMDILPLIAKEYGVSTDWLLGVDAEEEVPTFIEVPIIGRIRAGYPLETFQVDNGSVKIPADYKPSGECFALEVVGDSMMPLVLEGDIIVCEKILPAKANGRICVITIDGESTLKRIRIDSDGVTLIPVNPMYKETHFTKLECTKKNLRIDGVVVQMIRKFS